MINNLTRALFLAVLLNWLITQGAFAAIYFETINSEQGLKSNYVNHIIQRQDGFIWVGTNEGLSRFDGYDFVHYTSDPDNPASLTSSGVLALFEDSQSRLWVGTENGVSRLRPNEREFVAYPYQNGAERTIAGPQAHFFLEDSIGRIWIGTTQGISLYQPDTDDFRNFRPAPLTAENTKANIVSFILEIKSNQYWVGTNSGLFQLDADDGTFSRIGIAGLPDNYAYASYIYDRHGTLWIATFNDGLIAFDPVTQTTTHYRHEPENSNSISTDSGWHIGTDDLGRIWYTSLNDGISIIDPLTGVVTRLKHKFADTQTIPHDRVTSVLRDSSGAMWISTFDGIAFHNPDQIIENIRPVPGDSESLSSNQVWSFYEVEDYLWIGTNAGLNRFHLKTGQLTTYQSGQYKHSNKEVLKVWSILKADNKHLWLGTENGLTLFNTQTGISRSLGHLGTSPIWALSKSDQDSIWVGNTRGDLYRINQNQEIQENFSKLVKDSIAHGANFQFTSIVEDNKKNLWLTTSNGLFYLNRTERSVKPVSFSSGESFYERTWVNTMTHFKDNLYWVGSYQKGLLLLELTENGLAKKKYSLLEDYPEIENKNILSVQVVDDEQVWLTSSTNLYQLNPTTKELTDYGKHYLNKDINFHENANFLDSQGYLNFGTTRGVIRFPPKQVKKNSFSPKIIFTDIQTPFATEDSQTPSQFRSINSYSPTHLLKNWSFPYTANVIKFNFVSLDYMRPKNLRYAYQLQGFSEQWTALGNDREVTFTNLDAGNYTLKIKGTNRDQIWSEHQASINFKIKAKPWRTWWAFLAYVILTVILVAFYFRIKQRERQSQKALKVSEKQLTQALWGSGDELWEWNIKTHEMTHRNNLVVLGTRATSFSGKREDFEGIIHPDDIESFLRQIKQVLDCQSDEFESVYRQRTTDNQWVWLLDRAKVTQKNSDGSPVLLSGSTRNITNLKMAEENIRLIASAFQSSTDGAIIYDENFSVFAINSAFTQITGIDERIIEHTLNEDFFLANEQGKDSVNFYNEIENIINSCGSFKGEAWIRSVHGELVPVELRIASVIDQAVKSKHFVATITDIKFRKQAEADLRRLANFDGLTQLPNRTLLYQHLNHGLLQASREDKSVAILFLDLDNFKNVNDTLGHNVGDELLIAVADRLKRCIRRTDTVARLGGDEFTIALFGVSTIGQIIKLAEKVLFELGQPYKLQNNEIVISPSIGIAVSPQDGDDADTLLRQADTAMYHAKHKGRNNFQFFTQEMNRRVSERVLLESELRRALKKGEFELHYQPKFDLVTGRISGFEALLRWYRKDIGYTPPLSFIPVAEETGLILPLSEIVLDSACQQLKMWRQKYNCDTKVAINLSALQFRDKHLPLKIKRTLEKHQVSPDCLELEITESTLMENMSFTKDMLDKLRDIGVKLSLDDFGTGYSSLSYLKQFPIHSLKIDRSFIKDITIDARDAKMVEAIVTLAHNLDVTVVGEGIETEAQLQLLSDFGCEEIQGFLLSKPLKPEKALELLKQEINIDDLLENKVESIKV